MRDFCQKRKKTSAVKFSVRIKLDPLRFLTVIGDVYQTRYITVQPMSSPIRQAMSSRLTVATESSRQYRSIGHAELD